MERGREGARQGLSEGGREGVGEAGRELGREDRTCFQTARHLTSLSNALHKKTDEQNKKLSISPYLLSNEAPLV